MNHYISIVCVLAVAGLTHGSAISYGLGGYGLADPILSPVISAPIISPAAISTANMVKAAPIPVIRTVYSAPITYVAKPLAPIVAPYSLAWGKPWGSPLAWGKPWGSPLAWDKPWGSPLAWGGLSYGYGKHL